MEILFPSLNESKYCKPFMELRCPQTYLGQTRIVRLHLALIGFFPICKNLFPIIDQYRFFFTSGISPHILMHILEDCIMFLMRTAWVLFNFYLKQKERFSVWSFTENVFLISIHGNIWSRYS